MKTPAKIVIVLAVATAAAGTVVLKRRGPPASASVAQSVIIPTNTPMADAKLPKLLDLGATKCVPCKMMTPILESLKMEYAGKITVEFIDIWENEDAGRKYGVEMIPTQIFFDAEGKELFRHTGFFGKKDILARWKELGTQL